MANAPDECGVLVRYRLTDALDAGEIGAAAATLSPTERERSARFVFEHDRRDYIAAHALLRTTMSLCDPRPPEAWTFETDSHGKPYVPSVVGQPPPLNFSLSHSTGLVACAVAPFVDLGLDVASVDRAIDVEAFGGHCFSSMEMANLSDCPEERRQGRFFELWTLKEAFAKAVGRGLGLPLSAVTFDLTADNGIAVQPPEQYATCRWYCALYLVGARHVLALVVGDRTGLFSFSSVRVDGGKEPGVVLVRWSD